MKAFRGTVCSSRVKGFPKALLCELIMIIFAHQRWFRALAGLRSRGPCFCGSSPQLHPKSASATALPRKLHPRYASGYRMSPNLSQIDYRQLLLLPSPGHLFSPFCAQFSIGSAPAQCSLIKICPLQFQTYPALPRLVNLICEARGALAFGEKPPRLALAWSLPQFLYFLR